VSWLDVILVLLLALSIVSGYRRGATLQVFGLVGLIGGVVLGALVAPRVAALANSPTTAVALVVGSVLVGAAAGNVAGWTVGSRVRSKAHDHAPVRRVDAVGGSLLSVGALLLVTWFLALNLANGPFPGVARGIQDSRVVRTLDAALPQPPSLLGELQHVLALLGFPDVFVGLPPEPADPVEPPAGRDAAAATREASDSTVEILGRGCYQGFLNQGSGFVVAPGLVVTNAHVVAGTNEQWIHRAGGDSAAQVVLFDPALDIAILRAPGLDAPPLRLLKGEVQRGQGGAILGYPGGGPLQATAAAVRQVIEPVGRDVYGEGQVRRRVYELQASIHSGNSGGPFVLPDGRVAGVVFANSVVADDVGYALLSTEVLPSLQVARTRTDPVDTGSCTL
jgi:Trypsin-like peptidase domain/Colicin V production protein